MKPLNKKTKNSECCKRKEHFIFLHLKFFFNFALLFSPTYKFTNISKILLKKKKRNIL